MTNDIKGRLDALYWRFARAPAHEYTLAACPVLKEALAHITALEEKAAANLRGINHIGDICADLRRREAAAVGALRRLIPAAALLQANCESCAANHHVAVVLPPPWLADTAKDIEIARSALQAVEGREATLSPPPAEGEDGEKG
jgi:hypothetical protein